MNTFLGILLIILGYFVTFLGLIILCQPHP